ncbi:unnamed protein product [Durusdinium trenchii]|uniref:Uncharacterized protein n=1 Tax=Durusdinium trenchii TaxID=1381693 RepID=A0ABP0KF78_9DINO
MKYAELPEGKVDLNLLNSMSKSFDRFLAHCQKLHNMGRIKMGGLECSFRDMLTNPDDEINCHRINFAHGISEKMTSLIAAMDDLMSPAAKWKDSLTEAQAQASEVASVIAVAETTVMQVKGKKLHNQTQLLMQAISDAKAFIDIHGEAKQSAEGKPLEEIDGLRSQLSRAIGRSAKASELKIEAMLVQAYKSSIKATQRDLVTAQLAAIAGADDLQESCIQPSLLAWGKGVLG